MSLRKVGGEEIGPEDPTPEEATKPVLGPQSPTVPQSDKVSAPRNISGKRVKSGVLPMHTRVVAHNTTLGLGRVRGGGDLCSSKLIPHSGSWPSAFLDSSLPS